MSKQNCNAIPPKALPLSNHPLTDFNNLYILRRKVLEPIFITPAQGRAVSGLEHSVFKQPVQVVVLGIKGNEVKLGLYAHPRLRFEQGPQPDDQWQQQWLADGGHPSLSTPNSEQPRLRGAESALIEDGPAEELAALAEAQYFLYQAVEALCDSHETRMATDWPLVKSGFVQWKDWLMLREKRVRELLQE